MIVLLFRQSRRSKALRIMRSATGLLMARARYGWSLGMYDF